MLQGFLCCSLLKTPVELPYSLVITPLTAVRCQPFEGPDKSNTYVPHTFGKWQFAPPEKKHGQYHLLIYLNVVNVEIETAQLCPQNTKAHSCLFCTYLFVIQVSITDLLNKSDINQFVIHFLCYFLEHLCIKEHKENYTTVMGSHILNRSLRNPTLD